MQQRSQSKGITATPKNASPDNYWTPSNNERKRVFSVYMKIIGPGLPIVYHKYFSSLFGP